MDVAIFIDGPVHDSAHQQEKDEQARMKLEDEAGWMVLRFHHDDARLRTGSTDHCRTPAMSSAPAKADA